MTCCNNGAHVFRKIEHRGPWLLIYCLACRLSFWWFGEEVRAC